MRKFFGYFSTILVVLSVLCSCEKNKGEGGNAGGDKLQAPSLNVSGKTSDSFTITWNSVDNALYYIYKVNDGEELSTSQPSITFTDKEIGTYKVEVKAKPVPDSGWSESDWSSVTVELELGEDWFQLSDVYLKDDDTFHYYKYNSVYFLLKGYEIQSVKMNVIEASVIEGMTDDQIIEELTLNMTDDGLKLLNSTGELEGAVTDLTPETEYVVAVMATHESGIEKLVLSEPIKTEPIPEMPEGLEDWIGSYKVTSSQTLEIYSDNGAAGYRTHDDQIEFTIDIEPSPNDVKTLYIYGWSVMEKQLDTRLPAMAQLSGDGGLNMIQGYVNYGSTSLVWMPVCKRSDNSINLLTICEVIFTMYNKDGNITLETYSGSSGGYDFETIATDLFIYGGTSVQIPQEIPAYLPAGEFTVERIDTPESSPRLVLPQSAEAPFQAMFM